jgi:hypothetical protein
MTASTPEEARKLTKWLIGLPVDYAKVHLGVPLDITRAVAEVAHAEGLRVTDHLESSIIPYVEAGVDGTEHGTGCAEAMIRSKEGLEKLASIKLWLAKFLGPWSLAEREYYSEVTEFLAKRGTFIEPTMVLWGASMGKREKWEREDYELLKNPGLSYISEDERILWLDHYYFAYGARVKEPEQDVIIRNHYSMYGILPKDQLREGHRRLAEFLCQLVNAGGHVVTGTDSPAVLPGVSLHREMEFLVEAGLSPMQAILAATKVGADYLGKGDVLGTVEEGKLADVIVVNGDPLRNITETRRIDTVIKDGEIIDTSYHAGFSNPIPRLYNQEFYGYPVPRLEKISPRVAVEDGGEIELNLIGQGFFPVSSVCLGGCRLPTNFVSQKELVVTIPSHLLKVGNFPVSVVNPKPHEFRDLGGTSNPIAFIVKFG